MSKQATEQAEQLRRSFAGPMSEEDLRFLRDMQGFIEFGIRNGLSFPAVAASLGHDLNEVARAGFDLGAAKRTGVALRVAGYSAVTAEMFGEAAEDE